MNPDWPIWVFWGPGPIAGVLIMLFLGWLWKKMGQSDD